MANDYKTKQYKIIEKDGQTIIYYDDENDGFEFCSEYCCIIKSNDYILLKPYQLFTPNYYTELKILILSFIDIEKPNKVIIDYRKTFSIDESNLSTIIVTYNKIKQQNIPVVIVVSDNYISDYNNFFKNFPYFKTEKEAIEAIINM
ncbi:MAG: hypothetical protein KDK90_26475 [Leptospiraceae bacterium]|nr:hypothetical protein [Leptospiraceae bacterium]